MANSARYSINFAPLALAGDTKVRVGRQPYDQDRLDALRREFRETHVFRRSGDVIIDVPVVAGQQPLGNVQEEIDLAQNEKLWPVLLSASLVRTFVGVRDLLPHRSVSVLGAATGGLILHPRLPAWVQRRTLVRFEMRTIYSGQRRTIGLICEVRLKNLLLATCADASAAGISPLGRYVQVEEPCPDPRFLPRRRLVGRIAAIDGDDLILDDHAPGYERLPASSAYLEARSEIVEQCVRHFLGADASALLDSARSDAARLHAGPGSRQKIEETLNYLRGKARLEAVPGALFSIGEMISSNTAGFPAIETIPKPVLLFDPSGTRKDEWSERGLKSHGPYDQRTFSPKQLRIAMVCQAKHEGRVDAFLAKFLDGIPATSSGSKGISRYGDGFVRRFALGKPSVTFFTASGPKAADYAVASREALARANDDGFMWDMAFVQVEEAFKRGDDATNPYFTTKSIFLKLGVPVQSVRLETMSQPDSQLAFSMNHMSLATYAKLRGTPWLLASQQTVAHELVIGLGSHTVFGSRIGAGRRFVGITTVFSSDGSYLLSDRTAVVPFDDYAAALYETLKRAITNVRKQDNWRSNDKVRLVFHMFKPPKYQEAEAIKKTVHDLQLEDVSFAFLHIAPDHPYVVFDHTQAGIDDREPKKGVLGPSRGLHLKLGDYESLVVFSGASELKKADHGMPRPCLLKLHRLSTFTDMTYLARQAFQFSGHSWRMLAPEAFPITIRYSDFIAQRLAGLSAVPGWDADAVRFGQIGGTLWFL
jgi:hypothetical protein